MDPNMRRSQKPFGSRIGATLMHKEGSGQAANHAKDAIHVEDGLRKQDTSFTFTESLAFNNGTGSSSALPGLAQGINSIA